MADVSNELIYELLKRLHADTSATRLDVSDIKHELNAMRGHLVALQSDVNNIYGVLARHDSRLERIERRLDLRELAEPQTPFRPDR